VIPFCATSCNSKSSTRVPLLLNNTNCNSANSLVAIGDEEGRIRLLESDKDSKPSFSDVYLAFRVHTNAIIDMVFSEDDSLLATASGDQTARVVDMATQTTFSVLAHHSASLKQVRFMPGSNSILATSSRDGGVKIWDLRCKGDDGPRHHFYAHVPNGPITTHTAARQPSWGRPINSIVDAHRYSSYSRLGRADPSNDLPSRGEAPGRTGDMSVTAIQFLPQGQEHLLLTASEGDASVKLWDIRSIHNKRKEHIALSQTKQPQSHSQWRHFGISSINLNGAGTRLYTLCKDNTVYAYSTAHLILGSAPELSLDNPGRRLAPKETKEGLGPMYGFRHPQFHATSFYVKSAMRKAKDGQSELLAVGSSDGCAVLFPTDERHPPTRQLPHSRDEADPRPIIRSVGPRRAVSARGAIENDIPISTNGTPLIRGHDREVGNLCWSHGGGLITVGDDYLVRCWREDANEARDLRMAGETGGRRWACGWADVEASFDEDDD
jgi:WD40 repeat protein